MCRHISKPLTDVKFLQISSNLRCLDFCYCHTVTQQTSRNLKFDGIWGCFHQMISEHPNNKDLLKRHNLVNLLQENYPRDHRDCVHGHPIPLNFVESLKQPIVISHKSYWNFSKCFKIWKWFTHIFNKISCRSYLFSSVFQAPWLFNFMQISSEQFHDCMVASDIPNFDTLSVVGMLALNTQQGNAHGIHSKK